MNETKISVATTVAIFLFIATVMLLLVVPHRQAGRCSRGKG